MVWGLVGVMLVALGFALGKRLPPPFHLGMTVTCWGLGGWALYMALGNNGGSPGCVTRVVHQGHSVEGGFSFVVANERCGGDPAQWRVQVVPDDTWWRVPRVVFRAQGTPEPVGVRTVGHLRFNVVLQAEADGVGRELPVVLEGLWDTPNRVWRFAQGQRVGG